jgi:cell division septation protein DedD
MKIFFKIMGLSIVIFLSSCAAIRLDDGSDRMIIWENPVKPSPTGNIIVDSFVEDTFALYYSMRGVISELDDFQLYLTGIAHDPIPFLTRTSTLNVQQAAESINKGYRNVISLDPESMNTVWVNTRQVLESRPELQVQLKQTLKNIETDLISSANINLGQVREEARALRESSKILIHNTFTPQMSLRERLLSANAFSKSLDVLGYLAISLPERVNAALQVIQLAFDVIPTPENLTMQSANFYPYSSAGTMNAYGVGMRKIKSLPRKPIPEFPQSYAYEVPSVSQEIMPVYSQDIVVAVPAYTEPMPVYRSPVVVANTSLIERGKAIWQVQVACFSDSWQAEKMLQRLHNSAISAVIFNNGGAGCRNRVVVAPANVTRQDAQQQLNELYHKTGIQGYLRQY